MKANPNTVQPQQSVRIVGIECPECESISVNIADNPPRWSCTCGAAGPFNKGTYTCQPNPK